MAGKVSTKKTFGGKPGSWVIARTDDGTIQINYTIPFSEIEKSRQEVVKEVATTLEIPGFRKGKAPLAKVLERIPENTLVEKTLARILPKLLAQTINEEKLSFAIYPKFELIKAIDGQDWEVRAITCELPEVTLGDYKKEFIGKLREKSLWTPEKGKKEGNLPTEAVKAPTHEEREQIAISVLLASIKVKIPKLLAEEEVNARLARLLERIEKLGLSLDSYIASLGKKVEDVRAEYHNQAIEALTIDLALLQIAQKEEIKVDEKEIDATIKASAADPKLAASLNTPEQRSAIKTVLTKRAALEKIVHAA